MSEAARLWIVILAIGVGTYLIRFSFIGLVGDRALPAWAARMLRYVPVAVMPGLVAPLVVWPQATGGQPDPARLLAARRPAGERGQRDHGHFDLLAARHRYLRMFTPAVMAALPLAGNAASPTVAALLQAVDVLPDVSVIPPSSPQPSTVANAQHDEKQAVIHLEHLEAPTISARESSTVASSFKCH